MDNRPAGRPAERLLVPLHLCRAGLGPTGLQNRARRTAQITHLERERCLVPLTGDDAHTVHQGNDLDGILFLEFDLGLEQLEPLHSRFASIIEHQVLVVPPFLFVRND